MKNCRFLSVVMISLMILSCATSEESIEEKDIAAEETAPVIIIVEEPEPAAEETDTAIAVSSSEVAETEPEEESSAAFEILDYEARQQSAILTISYPQSADLSLLSIDGGGYISEIKASKDKAEIIISDIESLSGYSLTLLYGGEAVTDSLSIKTDSFTGRYRWTAADGSESEPFVLYAEEAPAASDYRYYIYLDPEDSAFPDGFGPYEIRIAPLIDSGEPSLDDMKYRNAPEAYKWTNSKWNTGSMTPSRIKYVKPEETETDDEIRTSVASVALGFTAESDVRYVFHELDRKQYLSFYNKMDPNIANGFIKKNPSPGIRPYEENEYWYTLEKE